MFEMIYVLFENDDKIKKAIIKFVFYILGIKCEFIDSRQNLPINKPVLFYGRKKWPGYNGLFIQETNEIVDDFSMFFNDLNKQPLAFIDVDLLEMLKALISDEVNSSSNLNDDYDVLNRLMYNKSFQYKNKFDKYPLVNVIINYIGRRIDFLYQMKKLPLWPNNKKYSIVLSHDVDEPIKHAEFFNYRLFYKQAKTFARNYYNYIRLAFKYFGDKNKNEYWLFDDIIDYEKSLGFKSTFFFSVIDKWQQYAHPYDVNYKISDSVFSPVFKKIIKSNFEIGLHASYNAYKSIDRFISEKNTLEKIAQVEIIGLRHHYWHMAKNYKETLEMHNDAGFLYDSSVAFNYNIGFRNNSALPYPIVINEKMRTLNIIEIPTFCMDGNIFYNHDNVELGFEQIFDAISVIKKYNGIGSIDWHVRTSAPHNKQYKNWGELYFKILKKLSEDDEAWVTSFSEVYAWLKKRHQILNNDSSFILH